METGRDSPLLCKAHIRPSGETKGLAFKIEPEAHLHRWHPGPASSSFVWIFATPS